MQIRTILIIGWAGFLLANVCGCQTQERVSPDETHQTPEQRAQAYREALAKSFPRGRGFWCQVAKVQGDRVTINAGRDGAVRLHDAVEFYNEEYVLLAGGWVVGVAATDSVVHIDRVYIPELQPQVRVASVDLVDGQQRVVPLMRDGVYVVTGITAPAA